MQNQNRLYQSQSLLLEGSTWPQSDKNEKAIFRINYDSFFINIHESLDDIFDCSIMISGNYQLTFFGFQLDFLLIQESMKGTWLIKIWIKHYGVKIANKCCNLLNGYMYGHNFLELFLCWRKLHSGIDRKINQSVDCTCIYFYFFLLIFTSWNVYKILLYLSIIHIFIQFTNNT